VRTTPRTQAPFFRVSIFIILFYFILFRFYLVIDYESLQGAF
jgi:hypothetical protein